MMMKVFRLPRAIRPRGGHYELGLATIVLCACTASGQLATEAGQAADEAPKGANSEAELPYTVECTVGDTGGKVCLVDNKTFVGWRTFHAFCHVCHGPNALGSSFAPSLIDRLKQIDKERFLDVVENGFTGKTPAGEPGVMPAWKDNPNISKRYEELYSYLRARSDGALPGGRPKKFPKKASE